MGTTSNKEQKIELHLNINLPKNGVPGQTKTILVNSNNPSTVININDFESETNETTETSQTNPTNQSIRKSQNSANIQNVGNDQNNGDNQNGENKGSEGNLKNDPAAPPMPLNSSQKSFINTSTNKSFNINEGGADNENQDGNDGKNFTNTGNTNIDINMGGGGIRVDENSKHDEPTKPTKGGNIDINMGGSRRVEEIETGTYGKPTKGGNIDINLGGSRRVEENETGTYGKPTKGGNIDINLGGNRRVGGEYKTPEETPHSKPKPTINIGYLSKFDSDNDSDLSMSYNILLSDIKNIEESKAVINKRVEEGYFPLFIQLDKENPLFLFIKNSETLQNVLEAYKEISKINDGNKEYTLYNQHNKKLLPQDVPIKDLNLKYFSFISNNI